MGRHVFRPGRFPYTGSFELACHVIFGDDDLSRGGGVVARKYMHWDVKPLLSKRV